MWQCTMPRFSRYRWWYSSAFQNVVAGSTLVAIGFRYAPAAFSSAILSFACSICSSECANTTLRYCVPQSGPCRFTWVGSCSAKNASSSVSYDTRPGSNVTSTTSACPVRSVHTSLYVGCSSSPPSYPAAVSSTPGISANRASTPQKHPAPNVAFSIATLCCSFAVPWVVFVVRISPFSSAEPLWASKPCLSCSRFFLDSHPRSPVGCSFYLDASDPASSCTAALKSADISRPEVFLGSLAYLRQTPFRVIHQKVTPLRHPPDRPPPASPFALSLPQSGPPASAFARWGEKSGP